jgi:hypothetical protein
MLSFKPSRKGSQRPTVHHHAKDHKDQQYKTYSITCDHRMRVHRRCHGYGRGRAARWSHGRRCRRMSWTTGVGDRRRRPGARWWTHAGRSSRRGEGPPGGRTFRGGGRIASCGDPGRRGTRGVGSGTGMEAAWGSNPEGTIGAG